MSEHIIYSQCKCDARVGSAYTHIIRTTESRAGQTPTSTRIQLQALPKLEQVGNANKNKARGGQTNFATRTHTRRHDKEKRRDSEDKQSYFNTLAKTLRHSQQNCDAHTLEHYDTRGCKKQTCTQQKEEVNIEPPKIHAQKYTTNTVRHTHKYTTQTHKPRDDRSDKTRTHTS